MSTNSAAKLLKGSEGESKLQLGFVIPLLLGAAVVLLGANFIWSFNGSVPYLDRRPVELPTSPAGLSSSIITPTVAVYALDEATATPTVWPTPIVIHDTRVLTVEVLSTPEVEYVYITKEVSSVVEVTAIPLPTITPVPLAPGTVEICASVEGAKGLYIGAEGVVSGACKVYAFGVGQTSIVVQVNK